MLFRQRLNSLWLLKEENKINVPLLGWSLGFAPQLRENTKELSERAGLTLSVDMLAGTRGLFRYPGAEVLIGWGMEHYKSAPTQSS